MFYKIPGQPHNISQVDEWVNDLLFKQLPVTKGPQWI